MRVEERRCEPPSSATLDVAAQQPELPPDAPEPRTARRGARRAGAAGPRTAGPGAPGIARVDAELLDKLLNNAGEVSISRSRLEQQLGSIDFNLGELARTVTRLKDQLRKLEIETEAQILHRHEEEQPGRAATSIRWSSTATRRSSSSRARFAETANDVGSIEGLLENLTQDTQNLLLQQARIITELQNGLMRTRMVPFQRHVQRLARIVRQAATDTGKQAELVVEGAAGELDRQVLERMLPPFEHMLRNAVVHGIETPRGARGARQARERHDHASTCIAKARNGHRRSTTTARGIEPQGRSATRRVAARPAARRAACSATKKRCS